MGYGPSSQKASTQLPGAEIAAGQAPARPPAPSPASTPPAAGTSYHFHIEQATGLAIGDGAQVVSAPGSVPGRPSPPPPASDMSALRQTLNQRFDDPGLDAFCLDHFPQVYDKFARGMRKDEKITLLLDHCRREPAQWQRLLAALG